MAKSPATKPDDDEPLEKAAARKASSPVTRTVKLPSGGSLTMTLEINLLLLQAEERGFVFSLLDLLNGFEAAHSPEK